MKKLLFTSLLFFCVSIVFSQVKLGISTGFNQHVAGGGPFIGMDVKYGHFHFGAQMLTQINAFTPYLFRPYGDYRHASNAQQFFGGGISVGYEFKIKSAQIMRPVIFYRSSYFNSGFQKLMYLDCTTGNPDLRYLTDISPSSFSSTQSLAAGITLDICQRMSLDFSVGSGIYMFWDNSVYTFNGPMAKQGAMEVRPDLNANLSVSYFFGLKK